MTHKQNKRHAKVLLQGALALGTFMTVSCGGAVEAAIDRQAVVSRHNITVNSFEKVSPLSVGNGRFTFTCDVTGLQTFPALYRGGIPLTTMAEWGWHSVPKKPGETFENTLVELDAQGRKVSYPLHSGAVGGSYFRANPHQSNLAQLGFALKKAEGTPAEPADLTDCQQTLNLWTGIIESRFKVAGEAVHVETFCHPRADLIVVQVTTELIRTGRLALALQFPYASGAWGPDPSDWTHADAHTTTIAARKPHSSHLLRTMDAFTYHCFLNYSQTAELRERGAHAFLLTPSGETNTFQFCMALTPKGEAPALELSNSKADCTAFWKRFWSTGGAIDLSASTDSRWRELERRIILSRYLTAIQSAQRYPPQETGLTGNSWYGKFHLEMHGWHSVHFAVWDKPELLERSLAWYRERLPVARAIAERQGYAGVRWPKMVGPDGVESPSAVGPLLIWQQPHPIYLAELIYRSRPTRETLEIYEEVVSETARFMADYAHWNEERKCFELGPPLIPAREHVYIKESAKTKNPTYELANWVWSLRTANLWRERLGKPRNEAWERIAKNMAPAPMHNGVYVEADPFIQHGGHPTMLAAYGVLPETGLLDHAVMRQTLHHVMKSWDWDSTWGWDYPMIAMTAARLGEAEMALDALLKDVKKNVYLVNGHNYQTPGLPLYLPGNGGLLTAVAMMAGGWEGCPTRPAPGFPDNGTWVVKHEGLKIMP
jgi:hypothetical protein